MKATAKAKGATNAKPVHRTVYKDAPSSVSRSIKVGEILPRNFLPPPEELKKARTKIVTTIRLDADVLEWFKAMGQGYQTKINAVLRAYKAAYGGK
jgi:uncharacterized protein (DUF4415 family)